MAVRVTNRRNRMCQRFLSMSTPEQVWKQYHGRAANVHHEVRNLRDSSSRPSAVLLIVCSDFFGNQELGLFERGYQVFGQSHSHRVWRMMSALIDARPEWADQDTFEADREKMLQYGLSTGMTMEELFRITDPDVLVGLWTAAEAKGAEV